MELTPEEEIKVFNDAFVAKIRELDLTEASIAASTFTRKKLHQRPHPYSISELLKGYESIAQRPDLPRTAPETEGNQRDQKNVRLSVVLDFESWYSSRS